ncbi:MAG: hypothetical protein E3J72_08410 [Planctomycetota bacterium]|nr:MAG: hypothetical protein E3J72_08410 [Planctomycetota bacterium]
MANKPKEFFEFFRNRRREKLKNQSGLPRSNAGSAGNTIHGDDSQPVYAFRRDTVVVFGMLAAVIVAASFFLGVLLGRENPGENGKTAAATTERNRLLTPLPEITSGTVRPRGTDTGRAFAVPSARIRRPVRQPAAVRRYVIRVASYRQSQYGKDLASKNAAMLSERGYPARSVRRGEYITIEVGDFPGAKDPGARQMLGKLKAFQLRGGCPFKDAIIVPVSR